MLDRMSIWSSFLLKKLLAVLVQCSLCVLSFWLCALWVQDGFHSAQSLGECFMLRELQRHRVFHSGLCFPNSSLLPLTIFSTSLVLQPQLSLLIKYLKYESWQESQQVTTLIRMCTCIVALWFFH